MKPKRLILNKLTAALFRLGGYTSRFIRPRVSKNTLVLYLHLYYTYARLGVHAHGHTKFFPWYSNVSYSTANNRSGKLNFNRPTNMHEKNMQKHFPPIFIIPASFFTLNSSRVSAVNQRNPFYFSICFSFCQENGRVRRSDCASALQNWVFPEKAKRSINQIYALVICIPCVLREQNTYPVHFIMIFSPG